MSIAIQVENLSKQYRLGQIGTGSIAHDVNRWWHTVRGKEDPYLKIGETNDRTKKGNSEYVWSLKDINFTIEQGDAVGIIGRNGAGKSTLLKILSRVTAPTTGSVKARGRIASLLEVGTGFHPELSGRENIFLNGAILGMRKKEIKKRFDEIVDFAGVERYIDTPVKRYSSGMYVRLAFAVAAHLESEILIVDEVLAVGDAEFQKKCLGKMGEVSKGEGRTVLFVSHNMSTVKKLCNIGLYLNHGNLSSVGGINAIIDEYFLLETGSTDDLIDFALLKNHDLLFLNWRLIGGVTETASYSREIFNISFSVTCNKFFSNIEFGLVLRDNKGELIYSCNSRDQQKDYINLFPGQYSINFNFRLPLKHGYYEIDIVAVSREEIICQWVSKKKLQILSEFDTPIGENWLGILSEPSFFSYDKAEN